MSALFVVDSNFFIEAHRKHYPMDIVPRFWLKVKELAERGVIISIDKVSAELNQNNDDLAVWCNDMLPAGFFKDTSIIISEYATISGWAHSKSAHYTQAALNEFLDANEADAWLVAYALARETIIVTHEISQPDRKNKIKVPDACIPFNVRHVNTISMFRELKEQF